MVVWRIAYKAYFFKMAGVVNAFGMTCVLSASGLVAIIINSLIVVRYGRRRLLLISGFITCGLLQLVMAIIYDKNPGTEVTGRITVALSCLYLMGYNVSGRRRPRCENDSVLMIMFDRE